VSAERRIVQRRVAQRTTLRQLEDALRLLAATAQCHERVRRADAAASRSARVEPAGRRSGLVLRLKGRRGLGAVQEDLGLVESRVPDARKVVQVDIALDAAYCAVNLDAGGGEALLPSNLKAPGERSCVRRWR
jgi:hypothetical protein